MEPTPLSLLRGQNYFQLLVTGGIYINPKLLQLLLGTTASAEWPRKNAMGALKQKTLTDTSFSSPPPPPKKKKSLTVSICCD